MFQIFYPADYVESAYHIDFEKYHKRGYQGIIFDIDNTLVFHGAEADQRSIALFQRLHRMGFATCLISNNKEPRVKSFADRVRSPYIYKAGKPKTGSYRRAMEKMKTDKCNTLFVGDQLFTDIYGANRTGLYSILVRPLGPKEEIQIVLKRYLEKIVLFFYERTRRKKGLPAQEMEQRHDS